MSIYIYTYHHGEIEAEVEADSEEEADELLYHGNAKIAVNLEMLDPCMWDLADVLEEEA